MLEYLKYAEWWQSVLIICSYIAFLGDTLLMVSFIVFFTRYHRTIQAMLRAFLSTNASGISHVKANVIGRTFPLLLTIDLPEEEQIIEDLDDIEGMQVTVQAMSIFVFAIIVIILLYQICKRCRYTHSIIKYCFPFFPVS